MVEPMITCPTCKTEIKLTESLASPLIEATRQKYEEQIRQVRSDLGAREAALRDQQAAIERQRESIDDEVTRKVISEIERVSTEERRKARALVSADLDQKEKHIVELQEVLDERNTKLAEAQTAQADLIRKQRELDDAQRAMELTIETRVQESMSMVRDKAKKDAEEHLKLRILEKEHTISSMQVQIEELKRRAEQGSQQLQGEVQELELEAILRAKFPADTIEPVRKGEQGGDVLQASLAPSASTAARYFGSRSEPRNGAMVGCRKSVLTSGRQRPKWRSLSRRCSPKESRFSISGTAFGSPNPDSQFLWRSYCGMR
jgi:hypothetical protein